jgi:hypothetical protein
MNCLRYDPILGAFVTEIKSCGSGNIQWVNNQKSMKELPAKYAVYLSEGNVLWK